MFLKTKDRLFEHSGLWGKERSDIQELSDSSQGSRATSVEMTRPARRGCAAILLEEEAENAVGQNVATPFLINNLSVPV